MKLSVKLAAGLALAATLASPAWAQSAYDYYGGTSPLEGAYVGGYGGGSVGGGLAGSLGGVAGANFTVGEGMMVGAEGQLGATMRSSGTNLDALMLGKAGALVAPDAMVYATGGGGVVDGSGAWAVGAGAEVMASNEVGLRADALGSGKWGNGFNRLRITGGAMVHLK